MLSTNITPHKFNKTRKEKNSITKKSLSFKESQTEASWDLAMDIFIHLWEKYS